MSKEESFFGLAPVGEDKDGKSGQGQPKIVVRCENALAGLSEVCEQCCPLEMSPIGLVALKCCHWLHLANSLEGNWRCLSIAAIGYFLN